MPSAYNLSIVFGSHSCLGENVSLSLLSRVVLGLVLLVHLVDLVRVILDVASVPFLKFFH